MAVWLTGDTHGFHNLKQRLSQFTHVNGRGEDTLIVLGDFGLLWNRNEYGEQVKAIENFIKKYLPRFTLAFVAGNHENYDLIANLKQEQRWGNMVGKVSENIYHLKTGRIYQIEGESYAVYGGALSIDKHNRIEGKSWWAAEIPSNKEYQDMIESFYLANMEVDYFLTHTMAENEIHLIDKYAFTNKINDPVTHDIKVMKRNIKINKFHAFGHFHIDKDLIESDKIRAFYEDIQEVKRV